MLGTSVGKVTGVCHGERGGGGHCRASEGRTSVGRGGDQCRLVVVVLVGPV